MADPILLVTRTAEGAARFVSICEARVGRPIDAVVSPVVAIRAVGVAPDWSRYAGVVLTSAAALRVVSPPEGLPAWCVGERTAEEARAVGLRARHAGADGASLVATLLRKRPPGPLVHPRGRHGDDVAGRLSAGGVACEAKVVYDQVPRDLSAEAMAALTGSRPVVLPLFSSRSAALLAKRVPRPGAPLHAVAISARAAASWPFDAGARIAETPDAEAMAAAAAPLWW